MQGDTVSCDEPFFIGAGGRRRGSGASGSGQQAGDQIVRRAHLVLPQQARAMNIDRARADVQLLADFLAGEPVNQECRDVALAIGQRAGDVGMLRVARQVGEGPDGQLERPLRVVAEAAHGDPEMAAVDAAHDAIVAEPRTLREQRREATAGRREVLLLRIQLRERLVDDVVAGRPEQLQRLLVAVDHDALFRHDRGDGQMPEEIFVVEAWHRVGHVRHRVGGSEPCSDPGWFAPVGL